jgi:Zn-dependent protease
MVLMPLIGIATQSGIFGWASAPYDPRWSQKHPKRAAWMSLAGPAANFSLAIVAGLLMRIGLSFGSFVPASPSFTQIVGPATEGGIGDGFATILSIFFSLNILLGFFNLIPFPPLDGYGVLGLFTSESGALRLQEFRTKMGVFSIIGLVVAWQLFDRVYPAIFVVGLRIFYRGYHF